MRLLLCCVALSLAACTRVSNTEGANNPNNESTTDMTTSEKNPVVRVRIGQDIRELERTSPVSFDKDCLAAVKMCWYEFDRSFVDHHLPVVRIDTGVRTIDIEEVVGFSAIVDGNRGPTIEDIILTLRGLTTDSRHESNRVAIYRILGDIKQNGWKRYINEGNPRISGVESSKFASVAQFDGSDLYDSPWFDPSYEMSLEQWNKVGSFYSWYFQADNRRLTVDVQRSDSKEEPTRLGSYLVKMQFQSEDGYYGPFFNDKFLQWKELWPERLALWKSYRATAEAKIRAAGIKIDESYQDLPIRALTTRP